jgi:hypothetical protein
MALNGRRQHWRENWDPKADLVFLRKMNLFDQTYLPGDAVTPELREKLKTSRLRHWFNGGFIGLKDWKQTRTGKKKQSSFERGLDQQCVPVGGGWYEVTVDGQTHKVRGKEQAQELLNT